MTDRQYTAETTERKKLKFVMCVCWERKGALREDFPKLLRERGKSGYYAHEVAGNSLRIINNIHFYFDFNTCEAAGES